MKDKKELDKELKELSSIIDVWQFRLDNIGLTEQSFYSDSYETLVKQSNQAIELYNVPQHLEFRENYDTLTPLDIGVAVVSGGIGSVLPKLTATFFDKYIHELLSYESTGVLGKIFNHNGEWIDTIDIGEGKRVMKGVYHRYRPDGNHDLLNFQGLLTSIAQFGILKGTLKYYLHMVLDMCSQTGIPVPGTTNFLWWIRRNFGEHLFSLKNQSEWAGIRMGDMLQAGATSGIISLYSTYVEKIPEDSLRIPQMGIVGHGVSLLGSSLIASQTKNVKMLSKISYPASVVLLKNSWSFYKKLNAMTKVGEELDREIERLIAQDRN